MGDISKNFSRYEFACKDGCGFDTVDVITAKLCEEAREIDGGHPLTPNSGCRCAERNLREGGSDESQHLFGRAVDLPVRNPRKVYNELCRRYPYQYGFGLYGWGVHIDSKSGKPRRW